MSNWAKNKLKLTQMLNNVQIQLVGPKSQVYRMDQLSPSLQSSQKKSTNWKIKIMTNIYRQLLKRASNKDIDNTRKRELRDKLHLND